MTSARRTVSIFMALILLATIGCGSSSSGGGEGGGPGSGGAGGSGTSKDAGIAGSGGVGAGGIGSGGVGLESGGGALDAARDVAAPQPDAPVDLPAAPDGGGGAVDAGTPGTGGAGGGGSCSNPQLTFGFTGQGDANPNFTSAAGARTAKDLFIFSGFMGPDPTRDAGSAGVPLLYVQAFDAKTVTSKGPAQILLVPPNPNNNLNYNQMIVTSAAVAPTGQIVIVYITYGDIFAAFLDSSGSASDGGVAGLQVQRVVQVQANNTSGRDAYIPHVFWSNSSQTFVVSGKVTTGGLFVEKYSVSGQAASGGTAVVPTDDPAGAYYAGGNQVGSVGESGNQLGVIYGSTLAATPPTLTVLDSGGNQVGSTVHLASASDNDGPYTVAGTSQGFVCFYSTGGPAIEVFAPTSGGAVAGVDAGTFSTFTFTGTQTIAAIAIADNVGTGGMGGVGVALLSASSTSFVYVNQDGVGHQGPVTVFGTGQVGGDNLSMTNFSGSFVVTFYHPSNHFALIAASGCP